MEVCRNSREVLQFRSTFLTDDIWIVGDSIVFWGAQAFEEERKHFTYRYLALSRLRIRFMGCRGLRLPRLPQFLKSKLAEEQTFPRLVLLHCGTNDITATTDINDISQSVSNAFCEIFSLAKDTARPFRVAWSDVLPQYHYRSMSNLKGAMLTTNVNAAAQFIVSVSSGSFLHLDPSKTKFFRKQENGKVDPTHLSLLGYQVFFNNLDVWAMSQFPPESLMEVALAYCEV